MRPLRRFEEFAQTGVVRKRTPDIPRSRSLVEEANKRKEFLEIMIRKIGISDENANYFIESSYDVLISMIRAKLLINGFIASGEGAHEAEVAFMRNIGFEEKCVRFMNDLRYFRNGILYYGKRFDSTYGKKVLEFLDRIYPKLKKSIR